MRYLFILLLFLSFNTYSQQTIHTFELGQTEFLLDGKPFHIIGGELHPQRIPEPYWRHRIQMAKAMGCNTIALYIFWNHLEVEPGVFDFTSESKNIRKFVQMCQEEGMWVFFRPGPYVCAEWDFGGIPVWMLKDKDTKIRCMDPKYMEGVRGYVRRLADEMRDLQVTQGGPILMVQIENEYGSYGNDKEYLETVASMWRQNGVDVPFYSSDGPAEYMIEAGKIEGGAIGLDSGWNEESFEIARKTAPGVPVFSSETYPGWLTHWGEKWAKPNVDKLLAQVEFLLKTKKGVSFYVIHGGTNFGFNAGSNAGGPKHFQPDLTSYDYDAPIDEQGNATEKYMKLRSLIQKYVDYKIPDIPAPIPTIEISDIKLDKMCNLWDLDVPYKIFDQPKTFEYLDQNQGLVSYSTKLIGRKKGTLWITEPHDYAMVFLDGKYLGTINREGGEWSIEIPESDSEFPELEIIVEGMGHINYGEFMVDRKGITDRVSMNGMTLMNWKIKQYPMDENFVAQHIGSKPKLNDDKGFRFFKGHFQLDEIGDTFFDMTGYNRGMIYVNGHNLGRYWNIGPQYRLYCPAHWLNIGDNEIVVFDIYQDEAKPVFSKKSH